MLNIDLQLTRYNKITCILLKAKILQAKLGIPGHEVVDYKNSMMDFQKVLDDIDFEEDDQSAWTCKKFHCLMRNDEVRMIAKLVILKSFEAVEIEDLQRFDSILKDGLVHRLTLLATPQPVINSVYNNCIY